MKKIDFLHIMIYSLIVLLGIAGICFSFQNDELSEDLILKNIRATHQGIEDYIVKLRAQIDMEQINVPPMNVTAYFKKPDKIHLQSEGFAMLPREGMFLMPDRLTRENFYITLLGEDTLNTLKTYKLELVPRTEEITARKFVIWVDPSRWIIMKMETISWQGQVATIFFEYELVQKKYWLPRCSTIRIKLTNFKGFSNMMKMPGREQQQANQDQSKEGTITIDFFDYKINSGLSDSIFEVEKQ